VRSSIGSWLNSGPKSRQEDRGDEREDREPGYQSHLVAGRRRLAGLRGQREPGLEARQEVDLLLVNKGLGLAQQAAAFLGVLPGVQVARVVEPEDYFVLLVFGVAGAEYLRAKVAGELLRGGEYAGNPLLELSIAARPRAVVGVLGMAWIVAIVFLPFLLLLFPTGRLPSRRWRFVAWAVVAAGAVAMILGPFRPGETGFAPSQNPFGVGGSAGEAIVSVIDAISWFILFAVVPSALSLVLRYRRASGVERQQIKWFAFAAALVSATIVADMLSVDELLDEALWDLLDAVSLTALYAAVGVAILRHRLYDIDLVVNRTLVYGSLTAALVLVYVVGVVSLQYVFRVLTGSESQLAVVVTTLAIAALFGPLRSRIQAFIDRRFYRRKYDAAKTLEAFSVRLKDETDLDRLGDELVAVARATLQPEHVSLWLRPPGEKER
jgi:hypothetical protein